MDIDKMKPRDNKMYYISESNNLDDLEKTIKKRYN